MRTIIVLPLLALLACAPQTNQSDSPPEARAETIVPAASSPAEETCMGEPRTDMMCTAQYDPVCGCNKQTYSNACVARNAGVLQWTPGACAAAHPNE